MIMCHFYALRIIAFAMTCLQKKALDLTPLDLPPPRNVTVIRSITETIHPSSPERNSLPVGSDFAVLICHPDFSGFSA